MEDTKGKILSIEEIESKLEHYVPVPAEFYDRIPTGSHIRYLKKGDEPFVERFKTGGFVSMKWASKTDGRKMIRVALSPVKAGSTAIPKDSFVIYVDEIDTIYKKYDYSAFIEFVTFSRIITQLKEQIDALEARLDEAAT